MGVVIGEESIFRAYGRHGRPSFTRLLTLLTNSRAPRKNCASNFHEKKALQRDEKPLSSWSLECVLFVVLVAVLVPFHTYLTNKMGLSTAERNKRKRERKKRERDERLKQEEAAKKAAETKVKEESDRPADDTEVEIEYVSEPILSEEVEGLRKFRELVKTATAGSEATENDELAALVKKEDDDDDDDDADNGLPMSKRKLRGMLRPSVANLKRRIARPELVEAHDITAADPDFLLELKSVPGTVPVPRHWGRKRKYLQGKVRFRCATNVY